MEYQEAIHNLKPNTIIAMKIVGEAIVRTVVVLVLFIAITIILNLYSKSHLMIYLGFFIGSLIANISYVFNKKRLTKDVIS